MNSLSPRVRLSLTLGLFAVIGACSAANSTNGGSQSPFDSGSSAQAETGSSRWDDGSAADAQAPKDADVRNDGSLPDAPKANPPPTLDRLQVDVATAFDLSAPPLQDQKMLSEGPVVSSGDILAGHPGAEPSILLQFVKRDAKVVAGLKATVVFMRDQTKETCDWEINLVPEGNDLNKPGWVVSYDHVKNPTVKVGDVVKPGDILGTPGSMYWGSCEGPGRVELQINNQGDQLAYCPLTFFSAADKTSAQEALRQVMESWNKAAGKTIYDQSRMAGGGCTAATTVP